MSNLPNEITIMKKSEHLLSYPAKTYKIGRVCHFCGEPISDQERASKMHCTRWIDESGFVHDCKRKKHQLKIQKNEDILLDFSARQRETNRQLEKIIIAHGDLVSTEILNAYNIKLGDNLKFDYRSGIAVFEYLSFKITVNPNENLHKIEKL